jgi:hypothetical protein
MTSRTGFTSTSRATRWDEGLMVGTGATGAALFAHDEHHVVALAHERFFVPTGQVIPPPDAAGTLPALRTLLDQGPLDEAGTAAAETMMREAWAQVGHDGRMLNADPLLPVGWLHLVPEAGTRAHHYRRSVDWPAGRAVVQWDDERGRHEIAVQAHREDDRISVTLISSPSFTGSLRLGPPEASRSAASSPAAVDRSSLVRSTPAGEGHGLRLVTESTIGAKGLPRATVAVTVRAYDGTVTATGTTVRIEAATTVTLDVTVATELGPDAPELPDRPRGDHAELFGRSSLDLGSRDTRTVEEIRADPDSGTAFVELAYAAGRNTVISATGALPPTLQGVWAGSLAPEWGSDFTLNGNVQNGSCAALWSTGTPELLHGLFDLVEAVRPHLETNARSLFGAPGVLIPAHMTTHGYANHFSAAYPHQYWIGGAAWILRFAWDYAAAAGDRAFLLQRAWPFAQDVMAFYEHVLRPDAEGVLHAAPSYSPENTPAEHRSAITVDATSEIMMVADAAELAARIARLAGDGQSGVRWREWAKRLPPPRVAPDGQLAEWLDPRFPDNAAHRHASHLYAFWYGQSEHFPAELKDAARESVRTRLAWRAQDPTAPPGHMEMAFGLVQLGLAAAAVGDADAALQCVEWLARDHVRSNMMPTHDAGTLFNTDAAGGLPALVAAMLVGGDESVLALLPALPAAWPTGRVTGLRARGGVIIERLSWTPRALELDVSGVPDSDWSRPSPDLAIRLPWEASQATLDGLPMGSDLSFTPAPGHTQRFRFHR